MPAKFSEVVAALSDITIAGQYGSTTLAAAAA
jgi:hypothetical protein